MLADAIAQARDLAGFLEAGREAHRQAGAQMANRRLLLSAVDTRLAARLLADAQIMDQLAPAVLDAARLVADDLILGAYRTLTRGADPTLGYGADPKLPDGLPVMKVAEAGGAVAGLLAADATLG